MGHTPPSEVWNSIGGNEICSLCVFVFVCAHVLGEGVKAGGRLDALHRWW